MGEFAALESSSDVDDELAALRVQMGLGSTTSKNQPQLPQEHKQFAGSKSNHFVDTNLEQLKKRLDEL